MNTNSRSREMLRRTGRPAMHIAAAVLAALFFVQGALAKDGVVRAIDTLAYDATAGLLLKGDATGLYGSSDDGDNWQPIAGALPADGKVSSIAVTSGETGAIFVAGPGLGVLRSSGNSGGWTAVGAGLPSANVTALATHSKQPATLYAYLPEGGIYRTKDAGETWKLMDRGPGGIGQLIHTNMAGSMETGWLYAATPEGVRFSMDCFCLWREGSGTIGAVSAIAVDPGRPDQLYATSAGGIVQSANGGQDWTNATASPPQAVSALVLSPSGTLYAGTVEGRVFRSTDRANSWELMGD